MPVKFKLMKDKWYPQPHDDVISWTHTIDDATKNATMVPILHYDEGLGAPSANKTHPENASFALYAGSNCFANSRVDRIATNLKFNLTKGALETDKLHAVRLAFMVVALSFKENYVAIDELTSLEIQDILEVQTESTDRQGYPLWTGTKMDEKYTNSAKLGTDVPGLTTTQVLESIAFNPNDYYRQLQYGTLAKKLIKSNYGLKWLTLTKDRPFKEIRINMKRKAKRLNPYTQLALIVYIPVASSTYQYHLTTDTTAIPHVEATFQMRFNEWNQEFDSSQL